jgi:outer membrane protein assembly factor BamB
MPDVRATLVAEDMATQVAYSTALATRGIADPFAQTATPIPALPPIPPTVVILEPTAGPGIGQPESPLAPQPPPTDTLATPVPVPPPAGDAPPPTPVVAEPPSPTPVAVPTDTPIPTATVAAAEAQPTATFTATPTPSVTPTFIVPLPTGPVPPTPTSPGAQPSPTVQFPALQLAAQVRATPAELYFGPSTVFTRLVDGPPGSNITLYGRDGTGEWLFMCCPPNSTDGGGAWVRSAAVRPTGNPTPPGMPTTVSPNDVGRLPERQPPAALTPLPTPQPIPASDFPVFRRDRTLQGRVGQLPRPPLALAWPPGGNPQTPGFTSGVVVFGDNVVAAGSDNHIYSLHRDSGSQRWRYNVGETVTTEPAMEGGWLYFVTSSGRLYELDSEGNASAAPWPLGVEGQPYDGIVGWGNRLFLTAGVSGRDHLYMVDRINERVAVNYAPEGIVFPHAPAVGNQLVYVAGSALLALDAFSNPAGTSTAGEAKLIWRYDPDSTTPFTTSPVYSFPGVRALAELYVGDAQGRVWAFDANTGEVLAVSQPTPGQPVTMLAVNSRYVFAAGGGVVRALPRDNLVQTPWWVQPFGGDVVNSLLADESSVLASANSGVVQLYDASLGTVTAGNVNTTIMAGPPAVSGGWLFVAGTNGTMFGLREAVQ